MEIYGVPQKREFKKGDIIYLLERPNRARVDQRNDLEKKRKYKESLIKKRELFYKKGMLGIITKVDQKDGIYHIKFSKSMDVPEEQRRPLRLPPNWKKTKQLKKSFTYPFPSIGIYKKIRLATQQEINRTRSKIERTKRRESSSRKRKLRQRRDEVNTPRMKRDVQKAISILDDAIQGFDRNSLQELSDEVRELDDEIHQLLSDIDF